MSLVLISGGNLPLLDCLMKSETKAPDQTQIEDVAVRSLLHELDFSLLSSIRHYLLLVTHFPWPCLQAAGPNMHLWSCRHTHIHQLTPCLSHGLYRSRVRTHKALVGPAMHRARPYIYPMLLLRVTNMGTGRRGGVTQLSAHDVEWPLHSDDCVCDCCPNKYLPAHFCPKPGMAECQKMTHPTLCYTL